MNSAIIIIYTSTFPTDMSYNVVELLQYIYNVQYYNYS